MTHELVRTRAGDVAMRSIEAGEVMHPGVGPRVEAETLYVAQSRLAERLRAPASLVLFDVGLGAGSNAIAARRVAESTDGARLELVSFERDLGALTLALDHPRDFGFDDESVTAARALLRDGSHETARTRWTLRHGDLLTLLQHETLRADLVFWDPFSPRANSELWTVDAFAKLRAAVSERCALYTYSASTPVRLAMRDAGWHVGVGMPIGTKRQTTAAATDASLLTRPLEAQWFKQREPAV